MRVKGLYDGEKVVLLEPVTLSPNTEVEVVILEAEESTEDAYWEKLSELGLVRSAKAPTLTRSGEEFVPITVQGEPLSETIIESRR